MVPPVTEPYPFLCPLLPVLMLLISSQEREARKVQRSSDLEAGGRQGSSQRLKLSNLIRPITRTQHNQVFSHQGHWYPHWPSCCFWNTPDLIPLHALCLGSHLPQGAQGSPAHFLQAFLKCYFGRDRSPELRSLTHRHTHTHTHPKTFNPLTLLYFFHLHIYCTIYFTRL